MEILEKLFGNKERVKMMRLFLFNQDDVFDIETVSGRVGASKRLIAKELAIAERMGLIKKRAGSSSSKKLKHHASKGWILNKSFPYLKPLQNLLISQVLVSDSQIVGRLSSVAKLKLILIAGVFIQDSESRVDLLVVGEGLKKSVLVRVIKSLESEIGKELRYAAFEPDEFVYRLGMYDKLIRDILDYPHKKILDRTVPPPVA